MTQENPGSFLVVVLLVFGAFCAGGFVAQSLQTPCANSAVSGFSLPKEAQNAGTIVIQRHISASRKNAYSVKPQVVAFVRETEDGQLVNESLEEQ